MAKEKQENELETSSKSDSSIDVTVEQKVKNLVSETTKPKAPNLIEEFDEQLKKELPEIYVGDTVKVGVKITEGNRKEFNLMKVLS